MIIGFGLDILEIERMKKLLKNKRFCRRVFTKKEMDYILSKGNAAAGTAAGIFCAKEAFSKAIGTGLTMSLFHELEIDYEAGGRPYFVFYGGLREKVLNLGVALTISHTKNTAAAAVIIEKT